MILVVVLAHFLGVELFPTIARLGIGRISIFLFQWGDVGTLLLVSGVHASRRREEKSLDSILMTCLKHVGINQSVVA